MSYIPFIHDECCEVCLNDLACILVYDEMENVKFDSGEPSSVSAAKGYFEKSRFTASNTVLLRRSNGLAFAERTRTR